jgi:hypothetical protein
LDAALFTVVDDVHTGGRLPGHNVSNSLIDAGAVLLYFALTRVKS